MNRLLILPVLLLTLLVGTPASSADFEKGAAAYESGDYATALREWTPLAEQGDAYAQNNLGWAYANGQGVPQDYKTALKWFTLAAEQGWAKAQSNLGVMYQFGLGVSQNYKEAARWFQLSANQGNSLAKKQLSIVFESQGKKLRENNITCKNINACRDALEFYYKAAELGNGDTMILIPNILLVLGEKLSSKEQKYKNKQKMVMWWLLGNENINTSPKLKSNTNMILSGLKKDVMLFEAAQKLARECVRKKYKGC